MFLSKRLMRPYDQRASYKLELHPPAHHAAWQGPTSFPSHHHHRLNYASSSSSDSGGGGGSSTGNMRPGGSSDDHHHGKGLFSLAILPGYLIVLLLSSAAFDAFHINRHPQEAHQTISVIIPVLNEEACIARCIRDLLSLGSLLEIIVVDGGSTDQTIAEARRAGASRVIRAKKGRGSQMNAGAEIARGDILTFLHADTSISDTATGAIREALGDERTVLVGLRPEITFEGKNFSALTFHNLIKTWYGPLLFRPLSFISGLRLLFGDQALSCRLSDFRAHGGFNDQLPIMEDADLCLRMHEGLNGRGGRIKMLMDEVATTSGRRFAVWGPLKATYIHFLISINWYLGASYDTLHRLYKQHYTDSIR